MSSISDSSHPKQDKLPMNNIFKNCDINIDFNHLKLNDKGKDENIYCLSSISLSIYRCRHRFCLCGFQKTMCRAC